MNLSDIATGGSVYIKKVSGDEAFRQRIYEMGFIRGKKITVIKNAPLKDPIEYSIMGYNVSLRRTEAAKIEVSDALLTKNEKSITLDSTLVSLSPSDPDTKVIRVAMVGNPNAGKTSIFNFASNSRERVGNYTGVTVNIKTAIFYHNGYQINLTDLPGTYSLSAYSPEELYVRDFIENGKPDVVVNIVDATNLERNLLLTTQLIDMNIKMVVALNMYDELLQNKDAFDYITLGQMLGIPFIPTIGSKGKGIGRLFQKVIDVYTNKEAYSRRIRINYGDEMEGAVEQLQDVIKSCGFVPVDYQGPLRAISIRLLEGDYSALDNLSKNLNSGEIKSMADHEAEKLNHFYGEPVRTYITHARFGFIIGALKETLKPGRAEKQKTTRKIDNLITHKYLGFPIFLLFMWIMFSCTFSLGSYPQVWIDKGIHIISDFLKTTMPAGSFKDLLTDGILGGVGGVVIFLPNILILFFFISIMEDTGYMARAAFITDKLMHKIGLHGKSFIPLVMGFGCNVPAIMSTRTIENRNNRLLTMLINPFMSCSARLPVYILLIGAIFPAYKGSILFGIYLTGITMAVFVALLLKHSVLKTHDAPFVMELPPYRIPTARATLKHMWFRASQYLRKMGGVILVASILVWALGHYPVKVNFSRNYEKDKADIASNYTQKIGVSKDTKYIKNLNDIKQAELMKINREMSAEHQTNSYIGRIGKFIEPAIRPLGFDWRMGISLLTGITAKEIVISSMGVIYQADESDDKPESLQKKLREVRYTNGKKSGKPVFTPLATLSFMLFTLLYFPCIATVAAIKKESGSWRWAMFAVFFTTGLAWLSSFVVYQVGSLIL